MADKEDNREELIYMAKLSEQTERFDEMVDYMKRVIGQTDELKDEERNLLSIAYKNAVGSRRTAWRALTAYELKEKAKNSKHIDTVQYYKKRIEQELQKICSDILKTLEGNLVKNTKLIESKIFYLKMQGDFNRYLSEFLEDQREATIEEAEKSYKEALRLLDTDAKSFSKTNPLRLGVALNCSVFYYEIKNEIQQACKHAKLAFEEAINELDDLEEEQYKDSTTIMQLLRDNLTAWTAELEEGEKN